MSTAAIFYNRAMSAPDASRLGPPADLPPELREDWLLDRVRQRRLGHGKAAELAGVPRAAFLQKMARQQITPFDYDEDELIAELAGP